MLFGDHTWKNSYWNGILLSHKREFIWVGSNEVDEPRVCYTEWSKSERKKQISSINACVWNLERWYWWNYLQGSNEGTDAEDRLTDSGAEEGRREGTYGESDMEMYITICKIDSQWEFVLWVGELRSGLYNSLEGWDGAGGGRELQEGGDVGIPVSDSCRCLAETNTIL